MIGVRMVLASAVTGKMTTLLTIKIANDGTGTDSLGNYKYEISGKNDTPMRKGELKNWPRLAKHPSRLLQAVLNDAFPLT